MAGALESIKNIAAAHKIDPALVFGFIMTESGGNPFAIRYEPNYRWLYTFVNPAASDATEEMQQKTSWGPMQVMGAVARERGLVEPFISVLCSWGTGIDYGCRHIKYLESRGWSGDELISAYNAGRPVDYNSQYVEKVKAFMEKYNKQNGAG
jgi:soluble lytic murein transglycosylase-like protein